jgi:fibronectin type 3 domain-containing protein
VSRAANPAATSARRRRHEPAPIELSGLEPRRLFAVSPSSLPSGIADLDPAPASLSATLPGLNSKPDAEALLYLDFDGDPAGKWEGYNVTATPAYELDDDPATFTDAEIAAIQQIWARVAEKFSPFNLNVTTVNPGTLANKISLRAVIGGDGAWTGDLHGGIAYVGGFFNALSNTVYVFPENLGDGHPAYVAEAIAHEAGHGFGLEHQSRYDAGGNLIDEYHDGNGTVAPIMGASYDARGIWWYGPSSESADVNQDDLAILAGSSNGFGYRADDHGDHRNAATPLSIVGNQGNGAGVIENVTDRDFFSFVTGTGNITLAVSPAAFGAMLDLRLELYTFDGTLVASQDTVLLGETIAMYLDAGSYRLGVFSANNYAGDIGQYTVSASLITPPETLPLPTSFDSSTLPDGTLQLTWEDNATGELGYRIQRSTDGGETFRDYAETASDATAFIDADVRGGKIYFYRICAFDDSAVSPYTARLLVVVTPAAPTGVTLTDVASRRVTIAWNDVLGATAYVIERAKGSNATFKPIGLTAGNRNTFDDTGLAADKTYRYRVRAVNAGGYSAPSSKVIATTLAEADAPRPPGKFSATSISRYQVKLAWQDNSSDEVGFKIQWTAPGRKWDTLGKVRADKTSVALQLWRDDASFRVAAYNKHGISRYTDDAPIAAPKRAKARPPLLTAVAPTTSPLFSTTLITQRALESLFQVKPKLLA